VKSGIGNPAAGLGGSGGEVKGGIAGFSQQRKIFSLSDRKDGAEAPPFPSPVRNPG